MKRSALLLALALLALVPAVSRADSDTVLQGYAYTAVGHQPVVNARIWIASATDYREARTDARGRFVVFGLESGRYTVSAEPMETTHCPVVASLVTVAPGESDTVYLPLPRQNRMLDCLGHGYSTRGGSSYVIY